MRTRVFHWLVLWLLLAAVPAYADTEVDSIGITVTDMARAEQYYADVLGFRKVAEREIAGDEHERLLGVFGMRARIVRMQLGNEYIELMQFLAPRGRSIPEDSRSNDEWFQHIAIVVSDIDRAYARLREANVQHASAGPQRLPDWNPNAGGIAAFYFRDPDDNHLEIIQFPAGKGDPRWQRHDGRLFLGIDHTAIVVDDTEDSLRYWRDTLGFSVAGASENYGPEQERLNNVFGARLRITALRADAGPGVEFLEYLSPPNGRPMPADTQANDLWHWQINVSTDALDDIGRALAGGGYSPVSGGITQADERRGMLVRDPDGHAALLYTAAPGRAASVNRSPDNSRTREPGQRDGASQ